MMNNKRVLIFIVVAGVFILIPIVLLLFTPQKNNKPQPSNTTPSPTSFSENGGEKVVSVSKIYPEENTKTSYLPIQQVLVTFSEYIPAGNLVVDTIPSVNIKVVNSQGSPQTVIISADPVWKTGITTIKIG